MYFPAKSVARKSVSDGFSVPIFKYSENTHPSTFSGLISLSNLDKRF